MTDNHEPRRQYEAPPALEPIDGVHAGYRACGWAMEMVERNSSRSDLSLDPSALPALTRQSTAQEGRE